MLAHWIAISLTIVWLLYYAHERFVLGHRQWTEVFPFLVFTVPFFAFLGLFYCAIAAKQRNAKLAIYPIVWGILYVLFSFGFAF